MYSWLSTGACYVVSAPAVREWLTVFAEFAVAIVIYYEFEENRAGAFLSGVQEAGWYTKRSDLYEAYMKVGGDTLQQRANLFRDKLNGDPALRQACDAQWTYLTRLQYGQRWSLFHRNIVAVWFPQVLISMWVMLAPYLRERENKRPSPVNRYFRIAVTKSSKQFRKIGKSISIYGGGAMTPDIVIPIDLIGKLTDELDIDFDNLAKFPKFQVDAQRENTLNAS